MVDFQSLVIVVGLVFIILVAVGALVFSWRDSLRRAGAPAHMQTDLTNMMILFQTMRDILAQQKDLAREFNVNIDRKVSEVRELIESTGNVRAELDRAKREIEVLSKQTRKELAELERRLAHVDGKIVESRAPVLEAAEESVEHAEDLEQIDAEDAADANGAAPAGSAVEEAESSDSEASVSGGLGTPLEDLEPLEAIPSELEEGRDPFIERWSGLDFGTGEVEQADVELSAVEVEQTRDAFRDLLNLQPENEPGPSSSEVLNSGENGAQYLTPIQRRVYEYSDAGMRVPEIARALGVGKGEVRLVLSLRRDRER